MKGSAMLSEETTETHDSVDTDTETVVADEAVPELGDPGKRALDAERNARRAAERAVKEAQAELEKLREASLSETERAISQARREAREEATRDLNSRLVRAEAKAVATGRLADPEDIVRYVDLSQFEVDENGNVDVKALNKEIDTLLKAKPYLAAQRVGGDVDSGARGKVTTGNDMNSMIRRAAGRG
jgi:hypothetical protein